MIPAAKKLELLAAFSGVVATLVATTPAVQPRTLPSPSSSVSNFDGLGIENEGEGDGAFSFEAIKEVACSIIPPTPSLDLIVEGDSVEVGDSRSAQDRKLSRRREKQATSLVASIIEVESGGDPNAIGDGGKAVGVLQIHPIMVREVNRILQREEYTCSDRLDPVRSVDMFWVYTNHYSPRASAEVIARRWNGGPDGDREPATIPYWRKVQHALKARQETQAGR